MAQCGCAFPHSQFLAHGIAGLAPQPVAAGNDGGGARAAIGAFNIKFMNMVQSASVLAVASVADKTGLFKLLASATSPMTVAEIAEAGKMHPRYVLEVCSCLTCAEFLTYDKDSKAFGIAPAQAKLLTDENFPLTVGGWCDIIPALYMAVPGVSKAMLSPERTTGVAFEKQVEWGFADGMARLNTPGLKSAYVRKWLPAKLKSRLEAGIRVADLGTGQGALCLTLAQAFPASSFTGIDVDVDSVAKAQALLAQTALVVGTNAKFVCQDIARVEGGQYDLVVNHDCIHDLVAPVEVLAAIRTSLRDGGIFFSMEPKCGESLDENLSPQMAQAYAMSTLHCMTVSLAHGGMGLGSATFGAQKYQSLAQEAGFTSFVKVGSNAINNFYEISMNGAASL